VSRFLQTLLGSAAESGCGITTGEPAAPARRTWGEVHAEARRTMGALVADGLAPGDAVAVLAGEPAPIAPAVQGVWLAGGSVTMLHQPTPRIELAAWALDTVTVLKMISCRTVLLGPPFDALGPVLDDHGVAYRLLTDLHGEPADPVEIGEDATALLQLTSGSTAEPKAVRITHGNLHANITAMAATAALDRGTDVLVSWLPLFHDMGMVGFLTVPMTFGLELVTVTPADFLSGPLLWAELISRHRGTVTAAPNFAYALLARRLVGTGADDLDLSSLRFALNGAEPIDPSTRRPYGPSSTRARASASAPAASSAPTAWPRPPSPSRSRLATAGWPSTRSMPLSSSPTAARCRRRWCRRMTRGRAASRCWARRCPGSRCRPSTTPGSCWGSGRWACCGCAGRRSPRST